MSFEHTIRPSLHDLHRVAVDEVSCWRGRCTDHFARIEQAMSPVVAAMMAHPDGLSMKHPQTFGGNLAVLKDAVKSVGPFGQIAIDLSKALEKSTAALDVRNMLIHSTGRVFIDQRGDWGWQFRFQPTGANKSPEEGFYTRESATELQRKLQSARDKLERLLKEFAEVLAVTDAV